MNQTYSVAGKVPSHGITYAEAFKVWVKVAMLSFGGPAGQIAVMHRILVEEKKWISEERFMHAMNYCMVLPGPEAQQLATYIGWLLHKTLGGLTAGILFVLPGFISILILSILYAGFQELTLVQGIFFGIKAAVLAVVVEAVVRIGKRALKTPPMYMIAVAAFIAIFFFNVAFPLIVGAAALIGYLGGRFAPDRFATVKFHQAIDSKPAAIDAMFEAGNAEHTRPSFARAVRVSLFWLSLWLIPLAALYIFLGPDNVFTQIGVFFSKLAVVTFGGAYAVLAYMAQAAVETYGWLQPGEMLDGLGMAETTPGPLIQVVQFVGFMGAFREAGAMDPYMAALLASILATWVTFVPCFLWIFAGAPWVESLRGNKVLSATLSGITAAVVGVVLNLAVWFTLHVVFAEVNALQFGPLRLWVPEFATINWMALLLAVGAMIAMFRFHVGMVRVLLTTALLGVIYTFIVA
jgi:chromate transporter